MTQIEYLARCHCGVLSARYRTALAPEARRLRRESRWTPVAAESL